MSNRAVSVVAVLLIVAVVSTGPAGAFGDPASGQVDVETDSTQLNAHIQPDGDAEWEIVYRVRLDDENATDAFEQLRADIENDSTPYTDRMETRMTGVADDAAAATGREMAIRNVTVDTRTEIDYGVVVYRFEWTNFAAVDGNTLRAGDAIDQFYLNDQTTLRIGWPAGYSADSTTPAPTRSDATGAVWEGELAFDPGEPRVVLSETGGTDGTTEGTPDGSGGDGGLLRALGIVAAIGVAGAAWLYVRRGRTEDDSDGGGSEAVAASGDDGGPPPELLSNEEQVLGLVEDNGGRMKQKEVAEQLDWTAAKTSQVVSDLREEGQLDSFRLGRENVLTLPDVELEPGDGEDEN